MKNFSIFKSIPVVIGFVVLFTIFVTKTSYSQNSTEKEKQKTVIMKVTTDKDGKTTVIDTTFTTPEGTDPQEIEEMAEKLQKEMEGLEKEMEEMQIKVLVGLPGSGMLDSLHNIGEKMVILKKGHITHIPCPPDPPMDNEFFERHNWGGNWNDDDRKVFRFPHKGQTLTDILGDIPMEKVRNYSIKNTKYGKKIVIEIED